jgi:glycerol-3-phosphate O-acyltransferase / dihydroxyacetone phosphate acyltransferase
MIAYRALRVLGRLALRWFYRDVEVVGLDRLPARGPVLLASNHPNALVDALVITCTLRRPVTLTAKATLLENPITRGLLRLAGVVPLRRATDDATRAGPDGQVDPARNAGAFAAVLDVLERGGAVLLFPEGKSHSDPALAPLKTGLARIALMARAERRIDSLPIIPIGLTFERKWDPRSRVVMSIGLPVLLGPETPNAADDAMALTRRIDVGLRDVTLNFPTADDAAEVWTVSTILAEVFDDFRPLHAPDPPLSESVQLARRINVIAERVPRTDPRLVRRVDEFRGRIAAFDRMTRQYGMAANDVQMDTRVGGGAWFVIREALIAVLAGPLAVWGRVNHWLPLRLARSLAVRRSRGLDEPATNTIVAGLVLVLVFYAAQTALVTVGFGWLVGLVYAASLVPSATWDFRYADRVRRASARVKTYLRFRREPALQQQLLTELTWLRSEAVALNDFMDETSVHSAERVYGGGR